MEEQKTLKFTDNSKSKYPLHTKWRPHYLAFGPKHAFLGKSFVHSTSISEGSTRGRLCSSVGAL